MRGRLLLAVGVGAAAALGPAPASPQEAGERRTLGIPGTDASVVVAWIPAGVYRVGGPADEPGRDDDEGPLREVRVDGYWMTVHEVTYDQFAPFRFRDFDGDEGAGPPGAFDADAVTRPSPPYEDPGHGLGRGDHPATGMTRLNALQYARWLSLKTGRLFRLPTEAEWEIACRAGSDDPYGPGGRAGLEARGWFDENAAGAHHPVGARAANPWGLHDLQGNAAEWVLDGYDAEGWARLPADGPSDAVPVGDPVRGPGLVRGGAFDDPAEELRCGARRPETPAWKRRDPQIPKSRWWNTDSPHVGFRLVSPGGEMTLDDIEAWFRPILGGADPQRNW